MKQVSHRTDAVLPVVMACRSLRCPWTAAVLACTGVLTAAGACAAEENDPWFGRDKALHFTASALLAGGGYAAGTQLFDARYEAMLLGAGVAATAGVGKEVADAAGAGDPSWRDLAWDAAGLAAGLGLAWGLDLLLRGTGDEYPALGRPAACAPAALTLTF